MHANCEDGIAPRKQASKQASENAESIEKDNGTKNNSLPRKKTGVVKRIERRAPAGSYYLFTREREREAEKGGLWKG